LRVFQRKDAEGKVKGPFWYDFRADGKRYRGSTKLNDKATAEQKMWNLRESILSGEYERKRRAAKTPTVDKLVDRFLDEYKGRYGNLRSQHYVHRLPHIKTALGKKKADAVRVADVHKFRDKRLAEGASPGTVRKEMVALGTVYKWGMQMDLVMTNPVYAANKPPEPQHRERYLTPKEWKALLKALPEWLTPIATVAAFTGLRLKEVTNIARSDVDRNAGLIYVQPDNKTGRGRYVLPGKVVYAALDVPIQRLQSPQVFTQAGGKDYRSEGSRRWISRTFSQVARSAELEGVTFHTLRHSFATWFKLAGGSTDELQRLLGHSTPVLTTRYDHIRPGQRGSYPADMLEIVAHCRAGREAIVDTKADTPKSNSA